MIMPESSYRAFLEDIGVGFKFAFKNFLSMFLAMLGVLIVTLFVLAFILLFIVIGIVSLFGGLLALIQAITFVANTIQEFPSTASLGIIAMLLMPIILPIFVAIGALYGLAREIVESEGTSAEGVFTWYQRKFVPLAGAGIIIFLISVLPLGLYYVYIFEVHGGSLTRTDEMLAIASSVIWFAMTTGLLSMMLPAIIDGHSVKDAFIASIKMGVKYLNRVFPVWLFYLGLGVGLLAPVIWGPVYAIGLFTIITSSSYPAFAILFLIFILIPAMAISQSRVYLLLTSEEDEEPLADDVLEETPDDAVLEDPENWGASN
jgi:hypothetical protein